MVQFRKRQNKVLSTQIFVSALLYITYNLACYIVYTLLLPLVHAMLHENKVESGNFINFKALNKCRNVVDWENAKNVVETRSIKKITQTVGLLNILQNS